MQVGSQRHLENNWVRSLRQYWGDGSPRSSLLDRKYASADAQMWLLQGLGWASELKRLWADVRHSRYWSQSIFKIVLPVWKSLPACARCRFCSVKLQSHLPQPPWHCLPLNASFWRSYVCDTKRAEQMRVSGLEETGKKKKMQQKRI